MVLHYQRQQKLPSPQRECAGRRRRGAAGVGAGGPQGARLDPGGGAGTRSGSRPGVQGGDGVDGGWGSGGSGE